jgi:hypothetical protein
MTTWRRHFFSSRTSVRTTWKFRLGIVALLAVAVLLSKPMWVPLIGASLVCERNAAPSDALLIENFDPQYLLFERAEALARAGTAPRVLAHVRIDSEPGVPNPVSRGIVDVMARQARLAAWDVIAIRHTEPISLNAALQIRDRLVADRVTSVVVVTPGFRSRRSALVYGAVLGKAGISVRCEPVFGLVTPERWTDTWHGIQDVAQEFLKLQYYRLYVMPFVWGGRQGERAS